MILMFHLMFILLGTGYPCVHKFLITSEYHTLRQLPLSSVRDISWFCTRIASFLEFCPIGQVCVSLDV